MIPLNTFLYVIIPLLRILLILYILLTFIGHISGEISKMADIVLKMADIWPNVANFSAISIDELKFLKFKKQPMSSKIGGFRSKMAGIKALFYRK